MKKNILFLLFFLAFTIFISAENNDKDRLRKTKGEPSYKKFNINSISTYVMNNGESDFNPDGNSGLEFPKGSGKTAMFSSGFLWGGKVNGQIRVNGSVYRSGLVPGKIINSGVPADQLKAEDPNSPNVRCYRVRPDINPNSATGDLSSEIADGEGTEAEIRSSYEKDWMEWPASDGAPFEDVDGNGIYDSNIDIPGIPGADQTIWYVANDIDSMQTDFFAGSKPMGIELQTTVWGYNRNNSLKNTVFRKYKLINKSNNTFEDMYISQWNDPDVGNASDDFIGYDSLLNMTYAYNSTNYDNMYKEVQPPAIGFTLVQGPLVDSPGNFGFLDGDSLPEKKNLPVTSHFFFACGRAVYCQPPQGSYNGSLEWYNWFRGKYPNSEEDFEIPEEAGGGLTNLQLAGDPISQRGWIDGLLFPAGDRYAAFASGPFNLEPGETQEIVIAEVAALGKNNIDAIKFLRFYSSLINKYFFIESSIPPQIPKPQSLIKQNEKSIIIEWSSDSEIENYINDGFEFQGYNIYQLAFENGLKETAVKLASFDKVDGITEIAGTLMNPETGYPTPGIIQSGNDSGIKYNLKVSKDTLDNKYFIPGKAYYFAVTAYAFNPTKNDYSNVTESEFEIIKITFNDIVAGPIYGEKLDVNHAEGIADAEIDITIVDPFQTTGNDYEVYFKFVDYYLNENGEWIEVITIPDKINNPQDISPSYLEASAIYGKIGGTIELHFKLNLISPDNYSADGILLRLPSSLTIIDAYQDYNSINEPVIDHSNNNIMFGNNNLTQNGSFYDFSEVTVVVQPFIPPVSINYIIYDDGFGDPINAEGEVTINSVEYAHKIEKYWNLRNLTTGDTLLKNQTLINNRDIYTYEYKDDPVVEGFKISVDINYDPPIGLTSISNAVESSTTPVFNEFFPIDSGIVISDYFFNGTSSKAFDVFGIGTEDLNLLSQDYELRFTGVLGTKNNPIDPNKNMVYVKSGGQMTTIFSMALDTSGLANHPLNPNPGTDSPFLIRVPFEVWNVDQNKQVNLIIRDRMQYGDENPFMAWNTENRMYAVIVNSDYNENNIIPIEPDPLNSLATWVLVFWSTHWTIGDRVLINYSAPIQPGIDKFIFTTAVREINTINSFTLFQNYPNPFNPATKIRFFLPEPRVVNLEIFDILGRKVTQLVNAEYTAGFHEVVFSGINYATGVYLYRIQAGDFVETKKFILIK